MRCVLGRVHFFRVVPLPPLSLSISPSLSRARDEICLAGNATFAHFAAARAPNQRGIFRGRHVYGKKKCNPFAFNRSGALKSRIYVPENCVTGTEKSDRICLRRAVAESPTADRPC